MATAFAATRACSNLYVHRCRRDLYAPSPSFSPLSQRHRQTLFLVATPNRLRRVAVGAHRPPTPPSPDPTPPRKMTDLASFVEVVSKIQDRVKIFLAVLIWMSIFFWGSALEGRGRGKGKGKKSSRFK